MRGFDVRFEARSAVCVCVSLCLNDLLQLLGLPTQLLGRGEALPHLHEERRDLVAAQEARCSPLQPMQNARLHGSCVETNYMFYTYIILYLVVSCSGIITNQESHFVTTKSVVFV